ncbi:MAG TPA: acetyl-CoA carboxylase biotin carboxyl carrier protein [Gemmatimonadales bacterium]|nr:acetyl-CoA carboxylase biotin carboxyl carrier protein [Gemmatimonadales bacterium]
MNLDFIARLVQTLKDNPELGAIEVRRGLFGFWSSVRVSKAGHPTAMPSGSAVTVAAAPPPVYLAHPGVSPAPAHGGAGGAAPAAAGPSLLEIKSPMVGTFYKSPEPGAEPYVKVGSRVAGGQVVCIIEAMKIMNEIESEVQGVVREVCVENAQPVEFGQVLFRVDPNG